MEKTRSKVDALVDLGEKVTGKPIEVQDKNLMMYGEDITEVLDEITKNYDGGSGGTSDYAELDNKPQINGITLTGNKTATQLGLQTYSQPFVINGSLDWLAGGTFNIEDASTVSMLDALKDALIANAEVQFMQFTVDTESLKRIVASIIYYSNNEGDNTFELEGMAYISAISSTMLFSFLLSGNDWQLTTSTL